MLVSDVACVCGGCDGEWEVPELCDGVACPSEDMLLAVKDVAAGRVVSDGVPGITEYCNR